MNDMKIGLSMYALALFFDWRATVLITVGLFVLVAIWTGIEALLDK